jgi:hypothetical protein
MWEMCLFDLMVSVCISARHACTIHCHQQGLSFQIPILLFGFGLCLTELKTVSNFVFEMGLAIDSW